MTSEEKTEIVEKAIEALQNRFTDEELIYIRDYTDHWRLINAAIREAN